MPDIVGVGAVNVDYILSHRTDPEDRARSEASPVIGLFEPGSERGISAEAAEQLLADLEDWNVAMSPGGSGLNTIASIAAIGAGRSVGYVGVCGRAPGADFSFQTWLADLGIDTRHLDTRAAIAGTCVSYTDGGRRALLTTPGVNAEIMAYLTANRDSIVDYLAGAQLVLITSFANLEHINPLLHIVERLRAAAPEVLVCCDPGSMWTTPPVPAGVAELMTMVDWILVNEQEAASLSPPAGSPDQTIVVKGAAKVEIIGPGAADDRDRGADVGGRAIHHNRDVLADDEIVDDTGAGDAFAAGLLWALTTDGMSVSDGVQLGMDLAREKLRWPGLGGISNYAAIHRRFVDDRR